MTPLTLQTLRQKPFNGVKPMAPQTFPITKNKGTANKLRNSIDEVLDACHLHDGMVVSFHHHLRNGDYVLNMVMHALAQRGIRDITLVASSLFAIHKEIVPYIKDNTITKIICAYMSGPVAQAVSEGYCKEVCIIHSHGYRAYMLASQTVVVDIAFIAVPTASVSGDGCGSQGKSACGGLGYAIADAMYAKTVVVITDNCEEPAYREIKSEWVDHVVKVDSIGDPDGIVSGTTSITKDPVGLMIAKMTLELMQATGLMQSGFSFQTGAGGISLALTQQVLEWCQKTNTRGSFMSGGITAHHVACLEADLFDTIMDVQCFDLKSVASIHTNPRHQRISAETYAGPTNPDSVVNKLDIVVLGATEIDLNFNVNVTTGSDGVIMGGSGGHCDTAAGAKFTIIVSKLVSSRISVVVEKVLTVTTPQASIDALVTDHGIAIHPRHHQLIHQLKSHTTLPITTIQALYEKAIAFTGKPKPIAFSDRIVALSLYRDGTLLDEIHQVE